MKTIPEIKKEQEDKMSDLFKVCGVFFAFSNEQFDKNKTELAEGEKYVSIGAGGYAPKSKAKAFYDGMNDLDKWYKAEIKANKARKAHILYELDNHEAYYTGDIESTLECLGEDYTEAEVLAVFRNRKHQITDNMKTTFYFNTGVKFADYPFLCKGQIERGGTKQIPFECEDVPPGASFAFACDNDKIPGYEGFIVTPIVGGGLLSKFAYFYKPAAGATA